MRKSRLYIIIALLVLAVLSAFLLSLNPDKEVAAMNTSLYFFNKDGSTIVPLEKEIEYKTRADLFEKTVYALISGPDDSSFTPIMPKNVKLNTILIDDKNLSIDFSSEYGESGILTTYAVIKTMSQFPDVEKVTVTVGGAAVTEDYALSGAEINLESDDDCLVGMNLYFANKKKTGLVREYRKINITDTQPVEQYIVSELIKGPKNDNNSPLLAQDTGIISVETTDGTCYVNFKQDFISKNISNSNVEKLVIYSLVNALTERDHIKNVQFLIEGKKTDRFGNMEISNLFYRDESIIEADGKIQ